MVSYKTIRQDGEDRSPYVSSEPPIIDQMWMDLYDCKHQFWYYYLDILSNNGL